MKPEKNLSKKIVSVKRVNSSFQMSLHKRNPLKINFVTIEDIKLF